MADEAPLSDEERAELVECLLATLPDDLEELTEEEFAAELDRRRSEIEQGIVKPIPCSEVRLDA